MNDNEWNEHDENDDLTEAKIQEITWNNYFPQMRFWAGFELFEILFVLAAPYLIFLCDAYPGWPQYLLYHYKVSQLILLLLILAVSVAGMFFIFTAKDKSRLEIVKWLSAAGAVMMCLAFLLFAKKIGYPSLNEKKLYWIIFICALLHIVSCIKIFKTYSYM